MRNPYNCILLHAHVHILYILTHMIQTFNSIMPVNMFAVPSYHLHPPPPLLPHPLQWLLPQRAHPGWCHLHQVMVSYNGIIRISCCTFYFIASTAILSCCAPCMLPTPHLQSCGLVYEHFQGSTPIWPSHYTCAGVCKIDILILRKM